MKFNLFTTMHCLIFIVYSSFLHDSLMPLASATNKFSLKRTAKELPSRQHLPQTNRNKLSFYNFVKKLLELIVMYVKYPMNFR